MSVKAVYSSVSPELYLSAANQFSENSIVIGDKLHNSLLTVIVLEKKVFFDIFLRSKNQNQKAAAGEDLMYRLSSLCCVDIIAGK